MLPDRSCQVHRDRHRSDEAEPGLHNAERLSRMNESAALYVVKSNSALEYDRIT